MYPKWCFFWEEGWLLQFLSFSMYFRDMDSFKGRILLWAEDPSWNEPEGTERAVLSELAALWINRTGEIKHLCRERYRLPTTNSFPLKVFYVLETFFLQGISEFVEYLGDLAGVIMGSWLEIKFPVAGEWLYPEHAIILELETVVEHC